MAGTTCYIFCLIVSGAAYQEAGGSAVLDRIEEERQTLHQVNSFAEDCGHDL